MPKQSAGLLLFRKRGRAVEVFLVHPGGPLWSRKDAGAWSIPKGEIYPNEDPLQAAQREFKEETGLNAEGDFIPLGSVRQPGGKIVHAWALESDCDASAIHSNTFSMVWPPKSGQLETFPEIDRAEWFPIEQAELRILKGQAALLHRLIDALR